MSAPKTLIVGAGVTGLATAHALVAAGHDVTVLDRGPIPNPLASSFDRHRLIRPHYPGFPVYTARIREAFAAWQALWDELGERHYVETGVIAVSLAAGDWADRARAAMEAVGEPHETYGPAEFERRHPQFAIPDMACCLYTPRGGALLADRILAGYVRLLRAAGATLVENAPVVSVDPVRGAAVTTDGRVFEADAVVVAPGVGAPALFPEPVASDLKPQRSVLLYVRPPKRWAAAWAAGPAWVDLGGEHEYWGIPPLPGIPMKLGLGAVAPDGDPAVDRICTPGETKAILDAYRHRIRDVDDVEVVEPHCNWWTLAPEERFVLTRHERAFYLSACSGHGFKFGALTGRDVAAAMTGAETVERVADRLAARC